MNANAVKASDFRHAREYPLKQERPLPGAYPSTACKESRDKDPSRPAIQDGLTKGEVGGVKGEGVRFEL